MHERQEQLSILFTTQGKIGTVGCSGARSGEVEEN